MEKVNVYDWDKTIFPVDSTVAFVRWCLRRHPGVIRALLGTLVLLPGYWLGKVSKTAIKERMYGFLRRVPDVDAELEAFWAQNFARVNPWYLAQQRPDDIIISASPEFLVRIPAQKLGVRLLASRVDKHTGKTDGETATARKRSAACTRLIPTSRSRSFTPIPAATVRSRSWPSTPTSCTDRPARPGKGRKENAYVFRIRLPRHGPPRAEKLLVARRRRDAAGEHPRRDEQQLHPVI